MPWNETDREKYAVIRERYASDLSDEEFALVQPLLPEPSRAGASRPTRDASSTPCFTWSAPVPVALSAQGLPTFHHRAEPLLRLARQWSLGTDCRRPGHEGARGGGKNAVAHRGDRRQPGGQDHRGRRPTGYDAAKKVEGPQAAHCGRHAGAADQVPDHPRQRSGPRCPGRLAEGGQPEKSVDELAFVDGGYDGDETRRAAFEASRIRVSVVKRTDSQVKGFVVLPKRWIVERTFGWLNRSRRLAKDFEALVETSRAWVMLALGFLILIRRAARDCQPPG